MRPMGILRLSAAACVALLVSSGGAPVAHAADRVVTASGPVDGTTTAKGVRLFRGIPYAAPPVRDSRWRPPQPVKPWTEPLVADRFGPRCMQRPIYGDMTLPLERRERRLPLPERVDAGRTRRREAARAGLLLRRGIQRRRRFRAALRRRVDGASRHRDGDRQLSPGRVRVPRPPGADAGVVAPRRPATTGCSTRWRRSNG